MTSLHMINIPIDLAALRKNAAIRGYDGDEGLALHHFLSETFGKSVLQPFRLMAAQGANLYAYTSVDLNTLSETAKAVATPEILSVLSIDEIKQKTMPSAWSVGKRLGFELRTRPMKRLKEAAGNFRKGAEIDAYLLHRIRHDGDKKSRSNIYSEWLDHRVSEAFSIDHLRIKSLQQTAIKRNSKQQQGPDVIYTGNLTINDGQNFQKKLVSGVGRHCAYGYGMLLLRPLTEN